MRSVRKHFARRLMSCVYLSAIVMLSGCGNAPKEAVLAPADGVLKINGKPAANILVQFLPVVPEGDPAPTSTGVSNDAGEFELETTDGKFGAVVGRCKVLFVDMNEERVAQGESPANPPRIPTTLAVINPRTMEVEVKTENARFEFDLKN